MKHFTEANKPRKYTFENKCCKAYDSENSNSGPLADTVPCINLLTYPLTCPSTQQGLEACYIIKFSHTWTQGDILCNS